VSRADTERRRTSIEEIVRPILDGSHNYAIIMNNHLAGMEARGA
jgi:hypothetical protein